MFLGSRSHLSFYRAYLSLKIGVACYQALCDTSGHRMYTAMRFVQTSMLSQHGVMFEMSLKDYITLKLLLASQYCICRQW